MQKKGTRVLYLYHWQQVCSDLINQEVELQGKGDTSHHIHLNQSGKKLFWYFRSYPCA